MQMRLHFQRPWKAEKRYSFENSIGQIRQNFNRFLLKNVDSTGYIPFEPRFLIRKFKIHLKYMKEI